MMMMMMMIIIEVNMLVLKTLIASDITCTISAGLQLDECIGYDVEVQ